MLLLVHKLKVAFFMATTQTFETIVTLNAQQAKDEMAALKKNLDDLKQKKAEALKDSGTSVNDIKQINKEIRKAEDHVNAYRSRVSDTINTLQNLSTASIGEIEKVSRVLKQQMKSATNPEDYKRLEEHLERCKARINELKQPISATLSQYNTAIAEATRRAENFEQENALIDRTLKNISGSTALELETSLKLVNEQLANTHRGTEEYHELTEKAKLLKKEIAAVGAEQDLTKSKWSKFVNIFNTNWGAITQGLAAVTGLSATVRDCTNKYAAMNQEMFNVTKYTGQAIGEVEEMNESFKKMDSIPLNVQHIYATKYYKNRDEMGAALKLMPLKEQRQTIFAAQADGYFIYAKWPNKWNSDKLTESLVPCGFFSPIVRDADSTDSIEIKIAPASISRRKRSHKTDVVDGNHYVVCPSATDDYTGPSGSYEDEGGEPYSSVQEAIEGDATEDTQEENSVESDKTMSVFFTSSEKFYMMEGKGSYYENIKVPGGLMPVDTNLYCHFPVSFVDHRAYPDWTGAKEAMSMDLHQLHRLQYSSPEDLRKDITHPDIDTHNLRCIKFLTDEIPDPSKIYVFRSRRFVCQKIEAEVVDGCVSQIKTGYFYEIL